jgi:hypothetical protein
MQDADHVAPANSPANFVILRAGIWGKLAVPAQGWHLIYARRRFAACADRGK